MPNFIRDDESIVAIEKLLNEILEKKCVPLSSEESQRLLQQNPKIENYYRAFEDVIYWQTHTNSSIAQQLNKLTRALEANSSDSFSKQAIKEFSLFLDHLKRINPRGEKELREALDFDDTSQSHDCGQLSELLNLVDGQSLTGDSLLVRAAVFNERFSRRCKEAKQNPGDFFNRNMNDMEILAREEFDIAETNYKVACVTESLGPDLKGMWDKDVSVLQQWFQQDHNHELREIVQGADAETKHVISAKVFHIFYNNPQADINLLAVWPMLDQIHPEGVDRVSFVELLTKERLLNYFQQLNASDKKMELERSLKILRSTIDSMGGKLDSDKSTEAAHLLKLISHRASQLMGHETHKEAPLLTELAYRTAIALRSPKDQKNLLRYADAANGIAKQGGHSLSQVIACAALGIVAGILYLSLAGIALGVLLHESAREIWKKPRHYEIEKGAHHLFSMQHRIPPMVDQGTNLKVFPTSQKS